MYKFTVLVSDPNRSSPSLYSVDYSELYWGVDLTTPCSSSLQLAERPLVNDTIEIYRDGGIYRVSDIFRDSSSAEDNEGFIVVELISQGRHWGLDEMTKDWSRSRARCSERAYEEPSYDPSIFDFSKLGE
jgi:hypothetical protein